MTLRRTSCLEVSLRVTTEAPEELLPDYFQVVTKPFGFPRQGQVAQDPI
ncbi:MAG: hypothetical protein HQ567_24660 [Candidatus Nealsonbacteria bacterium]|nr:hypothetical protein [Candidatus Nealsonbacteria bacterium]